MEIARFGVQRQGDYARRRVQIGRNVAFWRQHRGMKQWELAHALGVSQSTISRLETAEGPPERERLSAIATYLEVPLTWLTWEPGAFPVAPT